MQAFFSHAPCRPQRTSSVRFAAWVVAGALSLFAAQAHAWSLDDVATLASQRAAILFKPAQQAVPPELAQMEYDDYRDIRFKPDSTLWRADKLAYEANFFHVGRHGDAVRVNEITPAGVKRLPYDPARFNFGKNKLSPKSWGDIGYGGVRFFSHLNSPTYKDELIVFSGASYFRALGTGQRYGLSARGLAVDTAGPAKEEFPRFTDYWLEKPAVEGGPLTLYALMDSERMTGAYRFDVKPGEQTVTEVRAKIFMRPTSKPVTTLGIAPLTSMFFFGENQPRPGDFRPEVHDSDGLMIATDDGQGGRNFHSFEDTEARYELRPSAWVTPLNDFGAGRVELLQFATPDETHDNVAAYWVPDKMPTPGQPLELAYQIAWQGKTQQLPPNGWVTQTRRGIGYSKLGADALGQQIQFVVDFAGPALDALPDDAKVEAVTTASANARMVESLAYRNPATGAWRMTLRVERLKPTEPAQANQPIELRAFLQNNNHTLSETWTNLITN